MRDLSSSRKRGLRPSSVGPYTVVITKVEPVLLCKITAEAECLVVQLLSKEKLLFHAIMHPPEVPIALRATHSLSKKEGRTLEWFDLSNEPHLVSCMQQTSQRELRMVFRTTSHLSRFPKPLAFQERTLSFLINIKTTLTSSTRAHSTDYSVSEHPSSESVFEPRCTISRSG